MRAPTWDELTPEQQAERRTAADADHEFIVTASRDAARSALSEAEKSIEQAIRHFTTLASDAMYDVEVAETTLGRHAPAILTDQLATLRGLRTLVEQP